MPALIFANTLFRLRTSIDRLRRVMGSGRKGVQTESSVDARNTRFPFPPAVNGHLHREKESIVIDRNAVVMAARRYVRHGLEPSPSVADA